MKRSLTKRGPLRVAGTMIIVLLAFCVFWPLLSGADPDRMDMGNRLIPPGATHLLGTDNFGRDLGVRLAVGGRTSLLVGVFSVLGAGLIGIPLGLAAGYVGRWLDNALMAVVDVFLAFPAFVLAIAVVALLGPGTVNLVIALVAVSWPAYARMTRALTRVERSKDYVAAARVVGGGHWHIMLRHLLPNLAGPLIVLAAFGIGQAIIAESGMSFLGLGVQPPAPSWGWILAYGLKELRTSAWMSSAAGLALLYAVLSFNLLGEALRVLLDPQRTTRGASLLEGRGKPATPAKAA